MPYIKYCSADSSEISESVLSEISLTIFEIYNGIVWFFNGIAQRFASTRNFLCSLI
ncbi:MAG: hypothetical protein UZ22_OP11002000496 [Microgenomates bacterium OLB23]|nr:MAG: hypothetical protein UZ22_OP11002000496 [Microgenomates bacterium OLB23]